MSLSWKSLFKCLRGLQVLKIQLTAEQSIKQKGSLIAKYKENAKLETAVKHQMKKTIQSNYWSSHFASRAYEQLLKWQE